MSPELEQLYRSIIDSLQAGGRGLVNLNSSQQKEIVDLWQELSRQDFEDTETFKKLLCLLDHTSRPLVPMAELFAQDLIKIKDNPTLVLALGSALRQVIEASGALGRPLPGEFLISLKTLLQTRNDPEVFEWILRNLEELGPKSIIVKDEVLKRRPGLSRFWSRRQRHCFGLIQLLTHRWSRLAPSRPPSS